MKSFGLKLIYIIAFLLFSIIGLAQTTAELITADQDACPGDNVTFRVTFTGGTQPYSIDYIYDGVPNSITNINAGFVDINVTAAATTGDVTLTDVTDGNALPDDALHANFEMTITIDLPQTNLTVNNTNICDAGDATITIVLSESGVSYQLREDIGDIPVGAPIVGTGGNISFPAVSPAITTTYNILATSPTACALQMDTKPVVYVNTTPDITLVVNDDEFCDGDVLGGAVEIILGEANTNYELRLDSDDSYVNDVTNVAAGNISIGDVPVATTTYNIYATRTDGSGCASELNARPVITVNPLPIDTYIVGDPNVCDGDAVNISISGSQNQTTYELFNALAVSQGTQAGTGAAININAIPSASGTYYIIATDDNTSCSAELTDKSVITVESVPDATLAVNDPAVCDGEDAIITVTTSELNTNYQLRRDADDFVLNTLAGTGVDLDFTQSPGVAGDYNIYAIRTVGNFCAAELTNLSTVTVNPLPANKVIIATDYCADALGGTITVPLAEAGVSYQIYTVPGAVAYGAPQVGAGVDLTWNNVTAGDYMIVATTGASCSIDLNTVTVTQNPIPNPNPTSSDADDRICEGNTVTLNAGDLTGVSWAWDNAGTLNNATIQGPIATPLVSTTYTVTVTDANGCQNTGSITINVDSKPTININDDQGNTFTICEGSDITLTGTSTNPIASWSWSTGDNTASTTVSPTLTTPYTLDITDINGCTNSKIQTVTVNDRPTANAGSDEIMCLGVGVTLTATVTDGTPGYTYAWSDGGSTASTTVNPLNDATYTVTVTDANSCSHTDDIFVDVVENPTVDAGVDQAICHGDVANLVATPGATGLAPFSYTWLPGGLSGASVNVSPTNAVYDAAPIVYTYTVTIEDQNGCTASDQLDVTVNSLTSLTVNNDGDTYCQDAGLIPLVAVPTGGVWSDVSTPGFIQAGDNIDPANPPTTPGVYTVRYTYTNTNLCVSTQDATVEILPYNTPNPTDLIIDNESDYCHTDGATYNITGVLTPDISGMAGVTEVISGPAGVIDDGSGNGIGTFIPSVLGQGTHTITYTITTPGCNASYSETINVGLPVTITAPTDMCVGDADQALVADDITGEWTITFTDDATSTPTTIGPIPYGDPAAVLQATQPGTYDISYEVSNAGIACVNSTTATCVVHDLPDLTFTISTFDHDDLDINFCTNDIQAILVGYDGGVLAGGGIFSGVGVTAAQFDPATGAGNYNITYDFTDANGCANTVVSNNVQVNLAPTVDITGLNAAYCEDDVVFTVTGDPISGTAGFGTFSFPASWTLGTEYTNPGDGTATIDPTQITPTGTYSLDYTVSDLNGCSGTVTEFFDINQLPTVDFNGIPVSGQICKNAAAILLTGSPTNANGVFSGDGITDNGDGTATFDPTAQTVGIHNITYTYTDPVTTCANDITKPIEVLPLPNTYAVTAPGGLDYCSSSAGITIGVSNSEDATNTYYLMQNGVTQVDVLAGTSAAFNFTSSYPAGNYTVIAENADGCQATFGNTVTPIEHPAIGDAGSIVGDANVCADGTTIYTYSVPIIANAADHIWTIPVAGVTIDDDRDDEIDVIFDNAFVTGDFEVYGTDPASVCPDGNFNTITVNAIPEPIDAGATIVSSSGIFVVCEEETGLVYSIDPADFTNETSFEWEISAGTAVITSTTTSSSITVDYLTGSLTGTVRVRAVNACGVSSWVTQAITVNPVPNVSINALGAGDVITCDPASQVQLNAASTENPLDITSWLWTASGGGVIVPGDETVQDPFVTHEGDFEVQIGVTTNALECYNTATITVGADKVAPVATIDPHGVLDCNNTTLSLQANSTAPSSYQWTYTPPANITVGANTDNPTVDAPGAYTVEVTDLSNSCTGSASTTVTEDVTNPNISVTDPATDELTCIVNSVDVEGNSTTIGATYQWSTLIGGATITNPTNATASVDMAGLYTLVVTDPANGCTSTLDVTVNEDVAIPVITSVTNNDGSDLTCSNTTVELEAAVAAVPTATFAWNTVTGTIDGTSGTYNQLAEVSDAADYTVVATNPTNGCQSVTSTITVNETLTTATTTAITPSETELTCTNSSTVTLTANITGDVGGSYLWTTVTGTIVPPVTAASVDVTDAGTYTLHYYHSVTGCESTASVVITDNTAAPTVAIDPGPYTIICTDLTPTLTATGDIDPLTTYLWTGPGAIGTPTSLSTTVDATGTYTITATGTNGCTATSSVGVTQDLTVPDISVTDPATDELTCVVNTVDVDGNSTTAGATYQWSTLIGGATITNPTNPTAIVDMAGLYTLVVTDPSNGCTSTLDVTVNEDVANPVITALTNNDGSDLMCNNTTVELEANVAAIPNATFAWSTVTGTIDGTSGTYNQLAEVSDPADYTVTATNPANGCESSSTITVNEDLSIPTINIAAPGQVTCTNTVDLDATGSVNATNYSWVATLGGNIAANGNTATPTVNAAGRYTVTAEHTTTGCTASDFVDVTEDNSVPVIDVFDINPGEILCSNPTVTLSGDATAVVNKTIQWTTADGNFTTVTNISNPTVDQGGTYTVTITNDDNGCQAVRGVTVSERTTPPTITIDVPLDFTCSRTQVNLDATGTSADLSAVSYLWTAGAGGNIVSGATTATAIVDAMATYTVEVTDLGNGCTNTDNVTTTEDVTPPDVSVDTNPDQITCDDATVILNGSSVYPNVSYQWTTTGAGTITNGTTTTPTVDAIGTYNLTVENLDNNCTATSANVIVTEDVTTPVVVPAAPSGDITCSVTEINISVSQVVGYSYSWSGPGNITTPNSYATNVDAAGTYNVVVEDINNGCTDTYTVDVFEDITAAVSPTINDIETCFGTANPSFNVISGTNVNWYDDLGLTVYLGNGNTYTPTETAVGTHTYYATSTGANGCESLPTEITFTIYDLPVAPATVDNAICEGGAAAQLSAIGTNINWYDNTSTFLITSSAYTPADVLAGTYTYYATQTDANGCESAQEAASYVINVVPAAPIYTDASIEVCETEANPNFTVVGTNVRWYKTIGGAVVSTGNTHQPDEVIPGTYLYYATQTENGCESTEATGDFTVNPMPVQYSVTGGGSYCEGGVGVAVGLANTEADVNYELWLDDVTLINDISGTGAALDFGLQLAAGDYTIYGYKTATSCRIKMNGGVTISINPLPDDAGTITGSNEVCQDETVVVYTVDPITDATNYVWTIPAGFTIVSGANSNSIVVDVDNTAADGTITVYGENACGTGNVSANYLVTVNQVPGPALNLTGPATICNDEDGVIYTVDQDVNATQYNWTLPQGATVVAGANSRQITLDFDNTAVNDDIVVAAANTCGEGASATLSITVNEIPYVFAGDQQDLCDDNTTLEGNVPAVGTGTWSIYNGAASITSPNDPSSTLTSIGEGSNELVWSITANGCTMTDTVTITNNTAYVEAGDNKTICTESLVLEGNSVPADAVGSWSVMTGAATFTSGSSPNTTATDFDTGTNILKWAITRNGCTSYDSVIIENQKPSAAYAGIAISVCGDTVQLNATDPGTGTGLWSVVTGAASFDNNNGYNTIARGLNKGDNTLRWTVTNGICTLSDEVIITNNQVDINAGVDQVLCDRTTTLDATAAVVGVGYWSVIDGSGVFVNQNDPKTTVTSLDPDANNLAWNINNSGCITTDTVVLINNEPTEADAGPDQSISGTTTTLAANTPAEGTGQWTLVSGSGNIDDIASPNSNVTALGTGENYFRWTITKSSCTSFDDVVITNFMSITTDAGDDQTICSDEAILDGNEPVFGFGEWSVIQGTALFDDYTSFNTRVTGLASGDNILQWGVWENGWTYDEVIITYDEPTVANAGSDQTLCDDSTNLAANDPIVGKGVWTILSGSAVFEDDSAYNTVVTDLAKGENIFKWTITNKSCSSSDQVSIINNLPTDAYAGNDQTICVDSTTLNPNTPSVGTGEWSVIAGAGNFNGNQVSSLAADTNILRWTISTTGCAVYDEITIVNNKPSEANAGGDKILCGDSIDLAASLPQEGTAVWTIQNGSAIIDDDLSPTTKVTDLGIGINVFRWTVTKNGCVLYDEVTVKNSFIEAVVGDDQVLCDETTVLEANNPLEGTGTWSILGGSGSASFDDLNEPDTRVTNLDKGVNTLRWTIENDICISYDDVVITNNLPTEAFAGPDVALCSNNATLAGNTPITGIGEWSILSGSANIIAPDSPTTNVTNLDYGVNTLRWTISNNGCTSTDEVVIANNSTIQSDAGLDQDICTDSTVLYGNEPPFGAGQWYVVSGSALFEDNNMFNSKINYIGNGQNVLRWEISNGECSSTDDVIITNNSPTKAVAGDDQIICGTTTNLLANAPTYGTGQWSLVSGAATFTPSNSNSTVATEINPGDNTLRWTITNNGCTSSDDLVITNALPYEANAGLDIDVCGTSAGLYANDPGQGTGQWTILSGTGTFENSSLSNTDISNLGFGANTLQWKITYEHCTTSDDVIVTNNQLELFAGNDQTVNESTILLAASNPTTGTGQWSVVGGTGTFVNTNNPITEVSNLGPGLNTFRWSVIINGCESYDDVSITYNVPPVASLYITASSGCPPLEVYFVNNSLDGLPFIWNFDDGSTSDQVSFKHTYNESGVFKPSLTVYGVNDTVTTDTTIVVYPQPQASFVVVNKEVYIPEEEAIFINESSDATTYLWDFGDGNTSTEIDPRHTYESAGFYNVELQVWSEYDCYDEIKVLEALEVIESGQVIFPNAFTPNLDGSSGGVYNPNDFSNDVFYPIGEGLENYHLEVFNRWGVLVFESKDINIGWDGYYDGKLLDEGVYVWKVTGRYNNGKDFKKVGTVMLLH